MRRGVWLLVWGSLLLFQCSDDTATGVGDGGPGGADSDWAQDLQKGDGAADGGTADAGGDGALADGPPAGPALLGVYAISGEDPTWGAYQGQAEIRPQEGTSSTLYIHDVFHVQEFADATFEGDGVALAWEGELLSDSEPYTLRVTLRQVGFIKAYDGTTRDSQADPEVTYLATFSRVDDTTLSGTFVPQNGDKESFSETWVWQGPSGAEPIWQNQRQLIQAHPALTTDQHNWIYNTFGSFHQIDLVAPYTARPEFQEGVHYYVFDPTDFDFYRANPDVLRVIQKVVDPISLAETRIRNRAYRQTLAQKATYYDQDMPLYHLNSAGMVSYYDPNKPDGQKFQPDGDGLEWTGDYVTSQALRYAVTQEQEALDNLLRALDGIILCYDIAPDKGDFARNVREHVDDGHPDWIRGQPPYEAYDWLKGANNDMLKGFQHGFWAAYKVLKPLGGYDARLNRMVQITEELLEHNSDAGDWQVNEAFFRLMLYIINGDLLSYTKYKLMFLYLKPWLIDWGNGSTYYVNVSDWSGNFMNIKSLVHLYDMELYLQQKGEVVDHLGDYRGALTAALTRMRHTRLGYYQLVSAVLGDFPSPPPELEDALWLLKAFPAPKVRNHIDWTINPDFCVSPVPNLPWKLDWDQPGVDRTVSLTAYPLFERPPSNVQWKELPGMYKGSPTSTKDSGLDFLLAYWFGRYHGVIDPSW